MLVEIETPDGPVVFETVESTEGEQVVIPKTEADEIIIWSYYNNCAYRFNHFYIKDGWLYVDTSEPDLFPFHKYKVIEE